MLVSRPQPWNCVSFILTVDNEMFFTSRVLYFVNMLYICCFRLFKNSNNFQFSNNFQNHVSHLSKDKTLDNEMLFTSRVLYFVNIFLIFITNLTTNIVIMLF